MQVTLSPEGWPTIEFALEDLKLLACSFLTLKA